MIKAVQAALDHRDIADTIVEVGQFEPRGMMGAIFAGGFIGSEVGGMFGEAGDAIGTATGYIAGREANADSHGMPKEMFVAASETTVYAFKMHSRRKEPDDLVFQVPRADLDVKVHARVNVRVLELTDTKTGSKIELEGNRLPITHAHDLIKYLAGADAIAAADAHSDTNG